jgi:hypothetical protein
MACCLDTPKKWNCDNKSLLGDKLCEFYSLTGSSYVFSVKFRSMFFQLSSYIYKDIDKFLTKKSSSICKLYFLNIYIPHQ